jgi:hypothetical protein
MAIQQRGADIVAGPAVIANGAALSGEIDLAGVTLVGIGMPAGWDAAALTFQVSIDSGVTWLEMQAATAPLLYNAAAGQFVAVDPALWRGVSALKVRSGTFASPVNQTASRTLTIVARPVA